MELIYNITRANSCKREFHKEDEILCKLSSKNAVAFTSADNLISVGDGEEDVTILSYVYVCDIDKPWDIYLVSSFKQKVICVEWHSNGYQLLISTEGGFCGLYEMEGYLMNNWKCKNKTELDGEAFVTISWFIQGVKIYLNGDKKESASYSEKTIRERQTPPLSHFGNKGTEGWIGVTNTGVICVGLVSTDAEEFHVQTEALCVSRNQILIADFMLDKNGDILLVTSNTHVTQAINSYRILLKAQKDSCMVTVKPMTNFFIRSLVNETKLDEVKITNLKFVSREGSGLAVIVGMGNSSASQVDLYNLTRHVIPLRRFYQTSSSDNKVYTYQWSHLTSVSHPSLPISIALPNFPVRYSSHDPNNKLFQYIAIAYKDGSIKIINKHSFQAIATTNLDMGFNDMDKPEKRRRVIPCIVNMVQTFTGCGLIGMDQFGCMYLMKVVNTRDTLTQVQPNYLVSILEYLLITGLDWWDVLISLKPGMIENVIQRLSDNFAKQPAVMQDVLFQRHMSIKASLYSCSASGQQRAADCHCKLLLHAIATHFKSQLRPKGLSAQDMGPVEKLSLNCSKNPEIDIDKVMMSLNPEKKDFVVDEVTVQATQPLIQWVADLVLYLLTSLPMAQGYGSNFPGYSILHDASCLGTLRELMVVIRIWGIINPRCLPHFTTTTSNLDPMLEMFKIMTRVWQTAKDSKGFDFDEQLIDKCCLLPSQIYVANNDQALFGNSYSSGCSLLSQNHPIKYVFKELPSHITGSASALGSGEQPISQQKIDMVHQINLGVNPAQPTKSCSRCGNVCLLESIAKGPVEKPVVQTWEGKWLKSCLCGGVWKID